MELLTVESFRAHVGQRYAVRDGGVELELVGATERAGSRPGGAFSLLFRGPAHPRLEQATWLLVDPTGAELALFLVPLSAHADGTDYEAVFG